MYELNESQIKHVIGGDLVFVTAEWKHDTAMMQAQIMSFLIAGAFLFGSPIIGGLTPLMTAAITGLFAGAYVYGLSRFENSSLENDTWYNFV